jgi:hypothetical protein
MEDLKEKLLAIEQNSLPFIRQFQPHITSKLLSKAQMKNELRTKLEEIGLKTLVGPQLFDKGEQVYLALKEWKDSQENGIRLAKLQEKVGEAAKEEALDNFFSKLATGSFEILFDQESVEF